MGTLWDAFRESDAKLVPPGDVQKIVEKETKDLPAPPLALGAPGADEDAEIKLSLTEDFALEMEYRLDEVGAGMGTKDPGTILVRLADDYERAFPK